ncbi:hypothetical protein IscW_ISCW020045 [Ixodes scapularis]|uniref:Uncharacterized protein n=1 Tax=Ixodes scapularis TaxID=6945 RepID=B7Q1Z0_IXOSC|nr:hypothetical protein IscW_ISCW020045 [Ixodes scapularis]|eukprot:XP_002410286.1 hypothetical protein IscW_ISCW020045 [Ixodes scapularis]
MAPAVVRRLSTGFELVLQRRVLAVPPHKLPEASRNAPERCTTTLRWSSTPQRSTAIPCRNSPQPSRKVARPVVRCRASKRNKVRRGAKLTKTCQTVCSTSVQWNAGGCTPNVGEKTTTRERGRRAPPV